MMPYLPPYSAPGYDEASGLNTGSMGFMTLPVERTVGGFENNVWNPNANPYPAGFTQGNADDGLSPDVNPFTQGYMKDGQWHPFLPGKIVIGQRAPTQPTVGNATQWVNGKEYNVNGNNYAAGASAPAPYQFGTAPGDARMPEAAPFNGFHFGQQGQPGYHFAAGTPQDGKFYSSQPQYAPDQSLGTFKPWTPAVQALQQYRSQP